MALQNHFGFQWGKMKWKQKAAKGERGSIVSA